MIMRRISKRAGIIIAVVVVVVLAIGGTVGGVVYAYWAEKTEESAWYEMGIDAQNPTIKYQIFVPIDTEGNRIAGAYNVSTSVGYAAGNYVRTDTTTTIDGLALVGWEGGIALNYVIVPDEASILIDGVQQTLPVKRIMVDSDFRDYYFRGNEVIENISIGRNVELVKTGSFAAMDYLRYVYVLGDAGDVEVCFEPDVFLGCLNFNTIISEFGRSYTE